MVTAITYHAAGAGGERSTSVWGGLILVALALGALPEPAACAAKEAKPKIPKPKNITLQTTDGVTLHCTWYAGTKGKKSVPIIMLHGWGGVRGDCSALASFLQRDGHAVIVPDLRGHGESRTIRAGDRSKELVPDKMGKPLMIGMSKDLEAVKRFLLDKNNQGELNIELLCVVAADAMCIVATNWTLQDWSRVQFPHDVKQGRDVKALVLLSPTKSFKGLTTSTALRHPLFTGRWRFTISVMILVGERNKTAMRDAKTIHNTLQRTRPKLAPDLKGRELYLKKDLYLVTRDVEFQGTKLLDPQFKLGLDRQIGGFIHYRLEERRDEPAFAWTNRRR